jgi:hypothetical protein
MNLFAKPPLGPDAHAAADHEHPDHQLRINRGPSNLAVKGLRSLPEALEVEMPINAAQQMITKDVVVEAEVVKQLGRRRLNAHHRSLSRKSAGFNESRRYTDNNQSLTFLTVSAQTGQTWTGGPASPLNQAASVRGGGNGVKLSRKRGSGGTAKRAPRKQWSEFAR